MTTITVRDARKSDFKQWESLWDGYTRFYEREPDAKITATLWDRNFDPYEPIHILVAELDGKISGLLLQLFTGMADDAMFSTDTGSLVLNGRDMSCVAIDSDAPAGRWQPEGRRAEWQKRAAKSRSRREASSAAPRIC